MRTELGFVGFSLAAAAMSLGCGAESTESQGEPEASASENGEPEAEEESSWMTPDPGEPVAVCGGNVVAEFRVEAEGVQREDGYEWTFCGWDDTRENAMFVTMPYDFPLPITGNQCILDTFLRAAPGEMVVPRVLIDGCAEAAIVVREDADLTAAHPTVADLKRPDVVLEYELSPRNHYCAGNAAAEQAFEDERCEPNDDDRPSVGDCNNHVKNVSPNRCETGWSSLNTWGCSSNNLNGVVGSFTQWTFSACEEALTPQWKKRDSCSDSFPALFNGSFPTVNPGFSASATLSAGTHTCEGGTDFLTHNPDYTCHSVRDYQVVASCNGFFHWTAWYSRATGAWTDHLGVGACVGGPGT